jgi:2-polyprenyl-6-methoxyphenol hydroxylase-like FAD-dependent oxidoreductase
MLLRIKSLSYRCCCKLNKIDRNLSASISEWDYDVFICGGGVVGASFASKLLNLTKGTIKIGMLDLHPPPSLNSSTLPDKRVYALSPKSIQFLKNLGAWEFIENRNQSYDSMQIWESSGPGLLNFSAQDMNLLELGRVVEDRVIQSALYESLKKYESSIDYYFNSSLSSISIQPPRDGLYFTEPAKITFQMSKTSSSEKVMKTITSRYKKEELFLLMINCK